MFATSLSAPLPTSLASHLFGRFIAPSGSQASSSSALASAAAMPSAMDEQDDDAMPDLAQRVREIGEW
nr:hypothetical protein [uncultured Acidovorax sp.]